LDGDCCWLLEVTDCEKIIFENSAQLVEFLQLEDYFNNDLKEHLIRLNDKVSLFLGEKIKDELANIQRN